MTISNYFVNMTALFIYFPLGVPCENVYVLPFHECYISSLHGTTVPEAKYLMPLSQSQPGHEADSYLLLPLPPPCLFQAKAGHSAGPQPSSDYNRFIYIATFG